MTSETYLPDLLRELADLADIRGASHEAADVRRAVSAIETLGPEDLAAFLHQTRAGRIPRLPGVGPSMHWRIRELVSGGAAPALEAARRGVPYLLRRLMTLPAVTPAEAWQLVRQFGVVTLPDLAAAIDDGRIDAQFDGRVSTKLRAAADALRLEPPSLTLGRAWDRLEMLLAAIASTTPMLDAIEPAGDVRRCEPLIAGLVLVGRATEPPAALDAICALPGVADVLHRSARRATIVYQQLEVDVRVAASDEYGTVLFNATGSTAHVRAVGMRRGRPGLHAHEEQVYAQAGLAFVAPELRQASGEVEAAASGTLPALLQRSHIRGDLHMHSTYSDGRDTMAAMVETCYALGHEYVAITDHSQRASASRTLSLDHISRQRDEIGRLRERYPMMTILHGVEVDILPDGRLDFDDGVLAGFDLVLASLHERVDQDGRQLTARSLGAIRHPLVTVLCHPGNRIVGRRPAYDLDFEVLYDAAAETGTALEIDGAPAHLDLDGEHARAAAAAGVTFVVSSDCHRARSLERQMRLAVGTARRGWIEPGSVLNARPITEVLAFIEAKGRRTR